jgi:hypothetical protein
VSLSGNRVTKYISLGERKRSDLIFDGEQRPDTFRLHIIHLATLWLKNPVATPQFKKSYFYMESILALRFSLFNFFVVPSFPNSVPTIDEWGDNLPRFREDKDDNPTDHLLEFHEVMHQCYEHKYTYIDIHNIIIN